MNQNDLQSEFNNILIEDNHLNFGLTINSVGSKTVLSNESIENTSSIRHYKYQFKKGRVSNEFKLVYITRGSGYVHFEGHEEIEIHKGHILLILPNQKYKYYHIKETEWKEHFIRFEADMVYDVLIKSFFYNGNQVVDVGFNEELVKIFQRSIDVIKSGLKSSQVYLSGMLLHILGLIISESKNRAIAKRESQLIEQAKTIMIENVFVELNLQDITSRLNISYSLFRKKFKEYTGLAPAKYFNELRLNKAKQLLVETNYLTKEISFMLQYGSTDHFATVFKKATGITPKEFRQAHLDTN